MLGTCLGRLRNLFEGRLSRLFRKVLFILYLYFCYPAETVIWIMLELGCQKETKAFSTGLVLCRHPSPREGNS